jgi:hypothetical protein
LLPISLGFVILYAGIYYELLYLKLEENFLKDNVEIVSNLHDSVSLENNELAENIQAAEKLLA